MQNTPLAGIADALDALAVAGGDRAPGALTPGELIEVSKAFGALKRHVDAAFAPVAAEVARQSRTELGKDSLARRQGFRTPVSMIATGTGASPGEAFKLVQVGEAIAPRTTLTGEPLPEKHPHVASGIAGGGLSVTAASAVVGLLDRVAPRVDAERLLRAEAELVALAPGLRPDELAKLIARAEAHLDPDGLEPRHDQARAERSLTIQERGGRMLLTGIYDVETGAPIKAAIEGMVGGALRRNEKADDAERDQRSVKQMQADALADLARHGLACEQAPTGVGTTVVVRMSLDDLQEGTGVAELDGIDQPIPAGAVRRMAADAQIIPCVLDSKSEILDWGRARRLFTPAQKLALAERDGGCVMCGAPVAWTSGHHLLWWGRDRGSTDFDNGALLCTACHHRVHDEGWEIRVEGRGIDAKVWIIPPPWIDSERTPRLGGRSRLRLSA